MSTSERTSADIFRLILDRGPLTLYSASKNSQFPLGTIHRHFKEMEKAGFIEIYPQNQKGRAQKPYGPRVFGFVNYSRFDKEIKAKLENYFLLWIDHKEFLSDLGKEGFDVDSSLKNPQKSKKLFRKFVDYSSGVEEKLDAIKNDPAVVPHEILVIFGEMLLVANPRYEKLWEELYIGLPGIRKTVDRILKNMSKIQRRLENEIKVTKSHQKFSSTNITFDF